MDRLGMCPMTLHRTTTSNREREIENTLTELTRDNFTQPEKGETENSIKVQHLVTAASLVQGFIQGTMM